MHRSPAFAERVFAVLLLLYPREFRDSYGGDVRDLFRDRYREARGRGSFAVLGLYLRTVPNMIIHGMAERLAAAHRLGGWGVVRTVFGGYRSLVRSPGISATVVLTLALGIGSTVALYSVVQGVILRPLPFDEPDRLVTLWEVNSSLGEELRGVSPWNFADIDGAVPGFESMAAWYLTSGTFRTAIAAEEVRSAQVTADFFEVLGAAAELGRTFRREDVLRYGPIVLSHALWTRMYGRDPSIIGKTVSVSGVSYEVVGVMPAHFTFPDRSVESWLAWDLATVYQTIPEARSWRFLSAVGRLDQETTILQAGRSLEAAMARLAETHPEADRGWSGRIRSLHEDIVGSARAALWIAFAAVTSLLLIACANVANLLLARVPARSRETAIRSSLGASRGRLLLELAAESLALASLAGALGFGLGAAMLEVLVALDAGRIPRLDEVSMDAGVVAFTVLVALATSVGFGLAPAVASLRTSPMGSLRDGNRTSGTRAQHRLREGFVSGQVALALVLLAVASLFRASFETVGRVDPGFDPEHVASFRVSVDSAGLGGLSTAEFYRALLDALAALPGVESAAAAQTLPMDPVAGDFDRPYRAVGASTESASAETTAMRIVTPGYLETMRMRLIEGGDFDGSETAGEPWVVVVNRTLARRLWPAERAVGRSLEIDWQGGWRPYTVVGVVEDVRHDGPRLATHEEAYFSHRQVPYLAMSVVARTTGEPSASVPALRVAVRRLAGAQPAYNFTTLAGLRGAAMAEERFLAVLLELFSGIALVLACAGVYGVIAYTVGHRRREIGVRMALGARPSVVVAQVFRQATLMAGVGAIVGVALVRVAGRFVDRTLYGVSASDMGSTLGAAIAVMLVAGVAAFIPARRAARVSPDTALRSD